MSFGLPNHLVRTVHSRALANASQWGGIACLAAALATVLLTAANGMASQGGAGVWPTVIALVPMIGMLAVLRRVRTVIMTIAYLVVGTFGTFLYALTLLTQTPSYRETSLFVFALPVIAMLAIGGAGSGALVGVLWSTLGYALAEVAVLIAAHLADRAFLPDVTSLLAYLVLVSVMILDAYVSVGRHTPQTLIHRAVRDVHASSVRHELAVEFAAELHDAVLSELVTVAASVPGELSPRLRTLIERDLVELGRDAATLSERHGTVDDPDASAWHESGLVKAIEQSRDDGLVIAVSGDRELVATLSPAQDRALGLAVRQCLVNVLRHAGTAEADVAISASDDELSVMVIDAGRGFVPAETAADRMGLRTSVHERIEHVGGTVTIWSSREVGTTVMLTLPIPVPVAAPTQSDGPTA